MTHGLRACSGEPRKANTRHTALLAALLAALLLAGCATGRSAQNTSSGWFDRVTGKAAPEPSPYYAGAARTKLYREPDAASAIVGELALHEAVLRYQDDRGFAFVKARKREVEGWVRVGQLIARLPRASKPPSVGAAPGEPAAADASPSVPSETPTEVEPPAPDAEPDGPERSIFDPY